MSGLLESFLLVLGINLLFFIVAFVRKTDVVTDLSYSLSFLTLGSYLFFSHGRGSLLELLVWAAISLWALRLGSYLLFRIIRIKIDHRFDDKRDSFFKFGAFWLLQTVTVWVIMLPAIMLFSYVESIEISILSFIGLGTFLFGLLIESLADYQKARFKATGSEGIITTGLYRKCRYPNYSGEIIIWWSVFLMILPSLSGLQYLSLLGPLCISLLLRFVSGIPLVEQSRRKKFSDQRWYHEYVATTGLLLPRLGRHPEGL